MKSQYKIKGFGLGLLLSFLLLFLSAPMQKANAYYGSQVSFQVFYDNLSPYGTWFNDPQYGYVWAPRVEGNFRPYYTNGYWANTNYGNMWMSDYNWGWATFHYGRWAYNQMYGWVWVPGDEWGPAWVTWRQGGGYYGWAPMGPGVTINISFGSGYNVPGAYWTFIPYGYIYDRSFYRHYSPRRSRVIIRNTTIINNTYIYNNNTYVTGPRRRDVERHTGRSISTYQVTPRNKVGRGEVSGQRISIYRPAVQRTSTSGHTPRPTQAKSVTKSIISRNHQAIPTPRTTTPRANDNTNRARTETVRERNTTSSREQPRSVPTRTPGPQNQGANTEPRNGTQTIRGRNTTPSRVEPWTVPTRTPGPQNQGANTEPRNGIQTIRGRNRTQTIRERNTTPSREQPRSVPTRTPGPQNHRANTEPRNRTQTIRERNTTPSREQPWSVSSRTPRPENHRSNMEYRTPQQPQKTKSTQVVERKTSPRPTIEPSHSSIRRTQKINQATPSRQVYRPVPSHSERSTISRANNTSHRQSFKKRTPTKASPAQRRNVDRGHSAFQAHRTGSSNMRSSGNEANHYNRGTTSIQRSHSSARQTPEVNRTQTKRSRGSSSHSRTFRR